MVWFLVRNFHFFHLVWHSNIFLSGGTFRKCSSILCKLDLVFSRQTLAEETVFCVFNKKSKFFFEIAIFSWVVEFLESILAFSLKRFLVYSYLPLTEKWFLFVFLIKKEVFVAEGNLGLYKRELCSRIFSMYLFQF